MEDDLFGVSGYGGLVAPERCLAYLDDIVSNVHVLMDETTDEDLLAVCELILQDVDLLEDELRDY